MKLLEIEQSLKANIRVSPDEETLNYADFTVQTFILRENQHITNLKGSPKIVRFQFQVYKCLNLTSLKGISKKIKTLELSYLPALTDISALWEIEYYDMDIMNMSHKQQDAIMLLDEYKQKTKNYLEVVKAAREKGLEEFFK